ncbi:MAG: hypothetical protein ACOC5F_06275 [Candidatus Aminicenantaceae bacterium]
MTEFVEDIREYHIIEIEFPQITLLGTVKKGEIFLSASVIEENLMDVLEVMALKWHGDFGEEYSFAVVEGEL